MVKNNNIIEEIQELIQQIKNEYQKGVDFEDIIIKDKKVKNYQSGCLKIISERLKNFLRRRFNFPAGVNDYLDYSKSYHPNHFFYRTDRDSEHDFLCLSIDGRSWEHFFPSQKDFEEWRKKHPDNHWDSPEEKNPKNCSVCGKLVLLKEGQMKLWNDHCRIIGVNDDGYSMKLSKPFAIAHFHPECAEKYFAGKEQTSENNARIKDKILRNLDKISFDQAGHLANAKLLKNPQNEYETQQKENKGVYQIKIDNEDNINLRDFDRQENEKSYLEIRNSIVNSIKQNISDWKIKKDRYNVEYLENQKNGVKVWRVIFCEIAFENGEQDWAEIKTTLLKGSNSPPNNETTEITNSEIELLKNIFQELKIRRVIFENNKLTIEFNNSQITSFESSDNQKYKTLKNYLQKHNQKEITHQSLKWNLEEENTSTSPNQNKNNHQLVISLVVGAGAAILGGLIVYFIQKRKK